MFAIIVVYFSIIACALRTYELSTSTLRGSHYVNATFSNTSVNSSKLSKFTYAPNVSSTLSSNWTRAHSNEIENNSSTMNATVSSSPTLKSTPNASKKVCLLRPNRFFFEYNHFPSSYLCRISQGGATSDLPGRSRSEMSSSK
jgi:uncharacterized membrane protein YjgN (DUF898 family)